MYPLEKELCEDELLKRRIRVALASREMTQISLSKKVCIQEGRLSRIVNSHVVPSITEKRKIEKELGPIWSKL